MTVITSSYDKSDLKPNGFITRLAIEGIDIVIINIQSTNQQSKAARILKFIAFSAVSSWFGLRAKADVAVASSGPLTIGIPGRIFSFFTRKPLVFEVRDVWPDGAIELGILRSSLAIWLAKKLESWCYRGASAIVALSPGMAKAIEPRVKNCPIEVIPNASDLELFSGQTYPIPQSGGYALYAGSLGKMDGTLLLIDVAQALKNLGSSVQLVVFGTGCDEAIMRTKIHENGLTNINMMGLQPKNELVPWFQHALCSLVVFEDLPTLSTVSPNKLFDALASGLPIIQTTQGWIKELVQESGCGLSVKRSQPGEIASAIESLARNESQREEMARASLALAKERFDRNKLSDQMLDVIKRVQRTRT